MAPGAAQRGCAGAVGDGIGGVQHLEHPLERDECRHDVDAGVGQAGEGLIDAHYQQAHGGQRADRHRTGDDEVPPDPVDRGGAHGAQQGEGDHEHPRVHGRAHAQVAHLPRLVAERLPLGVVAPEQLHKQRSSHAKPLGHERVHVGVVFHLPPGQILQAPPHAFGGQDEHRQECQGQQGEPPVQDDEHRQQGDHQHAEVGHQLAERAGHGALRADHVVVQAADQRSGLDAGEERHPHALHVVVQRHPQVVDQTLADTGRPPALAEGNQRLGERRPQDQAGQQVHRAPVGVDDGHVDDLPEQQRRHLAQQCADQDEHHECGDHAPVGRRETQHPPAHSAVQGAPLHRLCVAAQSRVQPPFHADRLGSVRRRPG